MKKLLIIQLDDAYFLYETLKVLEKGHGAIKDFELTVLVSQKSLDQISDKSIPLVSGITTDVAQVLSKNYDLSFNLSMLEASWDLHGHVSSECKTGPFVINGTLKVPDVWSTFLLTIKSQPPFLTFHLQDIYKNILGIKKLQEPVRKQVVYKDIVIGSFNPEFYSKSEFEALIEGLNTKIPTLNFQTMDQVDLISDLSHTLYIGPATFEALRICEEGARGIFLGRKFNGLNLLPHGDSHFYISTRGEAAKTEKFFPFIESIVKTGKPLYSSPYSVYHLETENLYGVHLESKNASDTSYPFYQSHVVLWNFLLNLFEVNLEVTSCSNEQMELLAFNRETLEKLIRLHDYALRSIDIIYHESKAEKASGDKIDGHLQHLAEIDDLMMKISNSHPMLRPFLDFYRIRRGQNDGSTLFEQVQHSFLNYTEEHHALAALNDLFSVTLRMNEVSIR